MTTATKEYTQAEIYAIEGANFGTQFNENDVVRDLRTGRIIKGIDGPDDQLNVNFTTEATYDKLKTWAAGGVPKYTDMDFISISAPGSAKYNTVHRPVTDFDLFRFGKEYQKFKEGQAELITGTPLALWPQMSPSQIKELEYIGVRTVEQVATLADSVTSIMNPQKLKQQAKQFLLQAHDTAAAGLLQKQLDDAKAESSAQLAAMQAQIAELVAINEKQQKASVPKKEASTIVSLKKE